jgi:hypothetical protein
MDGPHLALAGDAVHFRVVVPIHYCTFTVQINDKKIYGCHASGLPDFFFFFSFSFFFFFFSCSYLLFYYFHSFLLMLYLTICGVYLLG